MNAMSKLRLEPLLHIRRESYSKHVHPRVDTALYFEHIILHITSSAHIQLQQFS